VGVAADAGAATNPLPKHQSQNPVKEQGGGSKQGGGHGNRQGASGSG
jgi:hypothetical protein